MMFGSLIYGLEWKFTEDALICCRCRLGTPASRAEIMFFERNVPRSNIGLSMYPLCHKHFFEKEGHIADIES